MWNLRSLLTKVFPVFTPLERSLLSAVELRLEGRARELFARQINTINLVQRHAKSREICCYWMKGGRPHRDAALRFPNTGSELKLARVRFEVPGVYGTVWTAEFILVKGFFFSIVFDPPAESIQHRADVRVIEIRLLADPMRETADVSRILKHGKPTFSGWLREWSQKYNVQNVYEPLGTEDRRRLLATLSAGLPVDYLELTEQADGFRIENCAIFGLAEVYEIVMEDSRYYVLAELDGSGVLVVKAGSDDRSVYYLDYREGTERTKVKSLREEVEAYIVKVGTALPPSV